MQKISVRFKRLKVEKFSMRDRAVDMAIVLNDGAEKEIVRTFMANKDAEAQVEQLFVEVMKMIRSINQEFDQGDIVEGIVTVNFEEEEEAKKQITLFLAKVFDKVNSIRNSSQAEGYLSMVNEAQQMCLNLKYPA